MHRRLFSGAHDGRLYRGSAHDQVAEDEKIVLRHESN